MKTNTVLIFTFIMAISISAGHHEKGEHGHHDMGNSKEWEIQAYTSAAPSFIGDHATVVGISGEVLREGTKVKF